MELGFLQLATLFCQTLATGLDTRRRRAPDPVDPRYELIVAIDTAGSGSWDDLTQLRARTLLDELVQAAFRAAGIPWHKLRTEDRGDGMILFIPATVPKTQVLDAVIPYLSAGLRDCNRRRGQGPRLRLRVAVHAGEVLHGPLGCVGTDLNLTCRLVNSRPVCRVFTHHPDADLILIASEAIYQAMVRHNHRNIDPARFTRVHVGVKEVRAKAWIHIPEPRRATPPRTLAPADLRWVTYLIGR
ncbi:MAG TPA: hypothetical protein VFV67_26750 [Actinophytocola sp.]|uniref:hypothetical protein n=1 Tax=Actinophytocola sp. TaxID=1872138 RepID=UPI002DBD4265|nr:hypothetical protein [Actinophytocola sp.]HEU5474263.1 hypothetical protein [Actinophytocola sp.]